MAARGLLLCALVVAASVLLGAAVSVLCKKRNLPDAVSRKTVHIGVSFFCFIFVSYIRGAGLFAEAVMPVSMIGINYLLVKAGKKKDSAFLSYNSAGSTYGTVWYAVSVTILTFILNFGWIREGDYLCGVLAMGFGDGLAGLTGILWGKKQIKGLKNRKTVLGSAVMFLVCSAVFILSERGSSAVLCVLIALAVTAVEALCTDGLDNIFVPLAAAFLCRGLL